MEKRYSIKLDAYNYKQYHKDMGLHCCDFNESMSDDAVSWCHEDENKILWCGNGEYSSIVNFCPNCGFESRSYSRERSKREDLDCKECKSIKWNIETECNPYILLSLIDESKMRCSEHCGNTVRDK